ncbi:MAG: type II toxin-antitoxin system PemK/MazF family toxin [Verrucomicrobiota bacterium]
MQKPSVGEIWWVDLGLTAKVRPCLILSDYPEPHELALMVIVPHTTAIRNTKWEYVCHKPFLKQGVFHLQQIQPVSLSKFTKKLGKLETKELDALRKRLIYLLNLS